MLESIQKDTKEKMQKSLDALKTNLSKLRSGRAHPSILDGISADYYGSQTPIKQLGSVNIEDAQTLVINVFDKSAISAVEKAIMMSDLGLNPASAGTVIRVPMPPLTEERRKQLIKIAKAETENSKIAIRNIRRDANSDLKKLLKDKEISEDIEKKGQDNIQNITNDFSKKLDETLASKEKELIEI